MNNTDTPRDLTRCAEALAFAVRQHARALERHADPRETIAAVNTVRAAARDYVQHVFAVTGWGNVFADLDADVDREESPEPSESHTLMGDDAPVVIYRREYKFRIHDFDRARQLLENRAHQQDAVYCEDYNQSYTGVVAGLAEVDGWKPSDYDHSAIEVLSGKWESVLVNE